MATSRGPVPKRSDQRRRRNKADVEIEKAEALTDKVEQPEPDERWHPIALDWYRSLAESGQARWYEPSDWQAARLLAEGMTRMLYADDWSGRDFAAIWSGMTELLTTEGARRRSRIEIERTVGEGKQPPGVAAIDDYRKRLGAG